MGRKLTAADFNTTEFPSERIRRIHDLRPPDSCHEQYTSQKRQAIVCLAQQFIIEPIFLSEFCQQFYEDCWDADSREWQDWCGWRAWRCWHARLVDWGTRSVDWSCGFHACSVSVLIKFVDRFSNAGTKDGMVPRAQKEFSQYSALMGGYQLLFSFLFEDIERSRWQGRRLIHSPSRLLYYTYIPIHIGFTFLI